MIYVLRVRIGGPLEAYASGFEQALGDAGFTVLSARNQLRVFAHLSRWLEQRRLSAFDLTQQRVLAFVSTRRRQRYTCWRSARGLDRILEYLRRIGVAPKMPIRKPRGGAERLISRYEAHLAEERGLAPSTIRRLSDAAKSFVQKHGASRRELRSVTPSHVRDFLHRLSRKYVPRSLAGFGSDLRSFFRFLLATGVVQRALADAVPKALGWRDATIPTGISASEAQQLLRSCDRRTARGRRDFAVIILLTRLGLRAGEVLALRIDEIDWRRGEIAIRGKGSKRDRLPLPEDVGRALSSYLVSRARTAEKRVFLRDRAPHRPLRSVGAIVFAASQRAGLGPVWPHRLRRTAATMMLQRGASLSEIAEVLRHSVTQTTAIYAKVDRRALRTVVRPWPGVRA